jgi:hypothetical protein
VVVETLPLLSKQWMVLPVLMQRARAGGDKASPTLQTAAHAIAAQQTILTFARRLPLAGCPAAFFSSVCTAIAPIPAQLDAVYHSAGGCRKGSRGGGPAQDAAPEIIA